MSVDLHFILGTLCIRTVKCYNLWLEAYTTSHVLVPYLYISKRNLSKVDLELDNSNGQSSRRGSQNPPSDSLWTPQRGRQGTDHR